MSQQSNGVRAGAVVTGGASGIGAATVECLLERGYRVHAWDVNSDALQQRWSGVADVVTREVNVTSAEDVSAGFAEVGNVTAVANIAGVQRAGLIHEQDPQDWLEQLHVNLFGTMVMSAAAVRAMKDNGRGAIVNMSSMAGVKGAGAGMTAYSASKGGVISFTKSLSVEAAAYGIRANSVCPGFVDTPFNDPITQLIGAEAHSELVRRAIPLQRQADPSEIASVIAFLLSDEASYVTGQPIVIDGAAMWSM